jgi:release factor glutamine methyltransferase
LAADISPRALEVAARNAARHEVAGRIKFVESDVFASVPDEKFDIIVSNPPYIAAAEINSLEPEVRDHEPISALTDGGDGLSIVRQVIDGAAERLEHGGLLLVEIGFGQSAAVERLVDGRLWDDVSFVSDLQGIPRTLRCRRRL